MDDQISEEFCNILHRLRTINVNDEFYMEDSVENIKPYTVDHVPIRKLFVGNLAQRTTHKDLQILFSTFGKLDSCYLRRNTGKSNYAFITFSSIEDALKATKAGLKKKIHLHNRDLRVMPADSWHQPDSIENQNKKVQKTLEVNKEISSEFELNEESEIHKLNNDCLMYIFTFLPIVDRVKMERVCRRWRMISQESWRTFKKLNLKQGTWGFNMVPREVDTPTLRKVLLRCGQFLTHIDFSSYAEKLNNSTVTVVGRLCPNLQNIDITNLNVSPAAIKALTTNCNNITEFSLGHTSSSCDTDLSQLFIKNRKLRYLKITQNSITGKCLLNLPEESIETIVLIECTSISPCFFFNALRRLKKLHTLSLQKCISFNDQALKAISLCSQSLKVLDLRDYYPMIRPNAMLHIAELVNLETLNLCQNNSVEDEFLVALGTHCKQLSNVDISSCHSVTNKGLASVVSLPKLEHLSINYLGQITDEVLKDIPNLRTLYCRGCPSLKDSGLCTLIEESPQIENLDFSGCNYVSNKLIEVAIEATKNRTNNIMLKIYVGETKVNMAEISKVSPLLQVFNVDLSQPHLRPDFDHNKYSFFPDEEYDSDDNYSSYDADELDYEMLEEMKSLDMEDFFDRF